MGVVRLRSSDITSPDHANSTFKNVGPIYTSFSKGSNGFMRVDLSNCKDPTPDT